MRYALTSPMLFLVACMMLAPNAYAAATVDCDTIMATPATDTYKLNPLDVAACRRRGWDAPVSWRPKDGQGMGLRSDGARGYSYGAVSAPESPPGARNANASVSASAIRNSCNFPPRISIGIPPKVTIPAGSCFDFLNDLFKDNAGNLNSAPIPPGIPATDVCPADSDTAGIYGVKTSVAAGGTFPATCGATVPITTSNLVMDVNATNLASTEHGSYLLWTYRKAGNGFALVQNAVPLPTYLCTKSTHGLMQKTVDLTPPVSQMISYNPSAGFITIRLQTRASMDGNFIPIYDDTQPEKFLVIPLNAAGVPQVPPNCANEATYYRAPAGKQDIEIQSATLTGCEGFSFTPTPYNRMKQVLVGLSLKWKDDWVWRCDTMIVSGPTAICPQAGGIPPAATCPGAATTSTTDANCDMVTLRPTGAACAKKSLYAVLNRPTLYYPSGTTATYSTLSGRTAVMAQTAANTKLFAQANTIVNIQKTSPPLTFDEGGTLYLQGGSMLAVNPPMIVDTANSRVTMTGGGQLLSAGGTQIQKFPANTVYTIPSSLVTVPLEVHVGRSVTLPAGYLIPTTPAVGTEPPYMRLPIDDPA